MLANLDVLVKAVVCLHLSLTGSESKRASILIDLNAAPSFGVPARSDRGHAGSSWLRPRTSGGLCIGWRVITAGEADNWGPTGCRLIFYHMFPFNLSSLSQPSSPRPQEVPQAAREGRPCGGGHLGPSWCPRAAPRNPQAEWFAA